MPEGISRRLHKLPFPARMGLYATLMISAFALAVALGSLAAVAMGGDLAFPGRHPASGLHEGPVEGNKSQGNAAQDEGNTDPQNDAPEGTQRESAKGESTGTPQWEELQGCERSQETCARDFVATIAPRAEYVGGRIDTDDSGGTHHVLYFVDPTRAPCEYKKLENNADASNNSYGVLIAGQGSFAPRRQEGSATGCVPEL